MYSSSSFRLLAYRYGVPAPPMYPYLYGPACTIVPGTVLQHHLWIAVRYRTHLRVHRFLAFLRDLQLPYEYGTRTSSTLTDILVQRWAAGIPGNSHFRNSIRNSRNPTGTWESGNTSGIPRNPNSQAAAGVLAECWAISSGHCCAVRVRVPYCTGSFVMHLISTSTSTSTRTSTCTVVG